MLALALAGTLLNVLFVQGAVWLGYHNRLAGLLSLTLVVLVKLVIIVMMFETLRPALPAIAQASRAALGDDDASQADTRWRKLPGVVSQALVPFFVYYAAWGFLSDTIRQYAREGLVQFNPFDETYSGSLFTVSGGWGLFASVLLLWVIRRTAKALKQRSQHPIFNVLIVLCDAGWTFVGLYVITEWRGGIFRWLAGHSISDLWRSISMAVDPVGTAYAAMPIPVENTPPTLRDTLSRLFFSALLPVVWLAFAALIYRYDVHTKEFGESGAWSRRANSVMGRWQALPKWMRNFVGHFWAGSVSRYRAAANSVYLVIATGIAPLALLVVLYRAVDWVSAWAWVGVTELIGPRPLVVWSTLADQVSILLGSPSFPGDGILPQTLKICLLAAALERSFRAGRSWRALK
ncbi:hypothetical protein [Bordetella sp. N]|uniref:hypothetical protein n=1 Tax=Bordetella sp. N TaxID=1746199 RepID=UPI0018D26509|nr:hypothetical protein [Bordetella sp. N]